jgi:hypothetical protein
VQKKAFDGTCLVSHKNPPSRTRAKHYPSPKTINTELHSKRGFACSLVRLIANKHADLDMVFFRGVFYVIQARGTAA